MCSVNRDFIILNHELSGRRISVRRLARSVSIQECQPRGNDRQFPGE